MTDKPAMMQKDQDWRLYSYPLPAGSDPASLFAAQADKPYSLFFDSNHPSHPLSRYSYLCVDPFETIECRDGKVIITNGHNQYHYAANPFTVVRERLQHYAEKFSYDKSLPPFQGGAAGFFGYDLVRGLEKIPSTAQPSANLPDMCIGLYDCIAAFDAKKEKGWIIVHAPDEETAIRRKSSFEQSLKICTDHADVPFHTMRSDHEYQSDIQKVIDYIYAGDIFQANLSRRFSADRPTGFSPYNHYTHLRNINPAPYAAYMNFDQVTLAASSPERFLSVSGQQVETRPIKGTLPSSVPANLLTDSEKDRAENAMIVDLLRNDLSKCCDDHSVEVEKFCAIETFEGLHHMVSTVKGTLRADKTSLDLLRACFPGGSVTGAPKIRAMEIIEELEPHRRGPYCGAMGWVGWNGDMDTNIIIRTIVYEDDKIHIQTGGGITAESEPAKELQETLTKAGKLFESFERRAAEEKTA